MYLSHCLSSLSPAIVRSVGVLLLVVVAMVDYLTGPLLSFSLFYMVPVFYVSWFDGRASGFAFAAATTVIRFLEGMLWLPDIPLSVHLWNAAGHFGVLGAGVLGLGYVHYVYKNRLKQTEDKYARVLEATMEGVVAVDKTGSIHYSNSRATSLLGLAPDELLGKKLQDLAADDRSRAVVELILEGASVSGSSDIQLRRKSREEVWTLVSASASRDPRTHEETFVFLLADITAVKRTEQELRQRYHELLSMQRLSSGLAKSLDYDKRLENAVVTVLDVTKFEAGCIYLLDEAKQELTLQYQRGLSPAFVAQILRWPVDRGVTGQVAKSGLPRFVTNASNEILFDPRLRKIEAMGAFASIPLVSKDKVLGVLNIIVRRKYEFSPGEQMTLQTFGKQIGIALENAMLYEQAQERERLVRKLTLDIVKVQEEERKRFAREIHDGLSQVLSTLKLNAELAAKYLGVDPNTAQQHLNEVITLSDEAQAEAKQIAFDLRPAILDDFGLKAAVSMQATNFQRRAGVRVEFHFPNPEDRFDSLLETTVYRIVQELLTNVFKHAEATLVTIQLLVRGTVVALTVADNGKGFDAAPWVNTDGDANHHGLRNVRERVEFLGGSFRAESVPGKGSEFLMEFPLLRRPKLQEGLRPSPTPSDVGKRADSRHDVPEGHP